MAKKKKAKPAEKENGERWLVSYSDFVTLLLGVFIIMYSMAAADADKSGSLGEAQSNFLAALAGAFGNTSILEHSGDSLVDMYSGTELNPSAIEERTMQQVKEEIEEYISGVTSIDSDSVEVVIDELGVHIRIKDTVLFNSGSHVINKGAVHIIAKIGDVLKNLPNNYIQIEGHTDTVPMSGDNPYVQTNWELGSLRASNVVRMLVEKSALNPNYLTAVSYGEFHPIASNDTVAGKAKNRRVEIRILRNYIYDEE